MVPLPLLLTVALTEVVVPFLTSLNVRLLIALAFIASGNLGERCYVTLNTYLSLHGERHLPHTHTEARLAAQTKRFTGVVIIAFVIRICPGRCGLTRKEASAWA